MLKFKTLKSRFQVSGPSQARLKRHDPAWAEQLRLISRAKRELKAGRA